MFRPSWGLVQRVVAAVGVPVVARLGRVRGQEPADARAVVAVSQQHQPRVRVPLIAARTHKTEWRRRVPRPAHRHPEGVVQQPVRGRLGGRCDPPRAAQRVRVVEPAHALASVQQFRIHLRLQCAKQGLNIFMTTA